MDSLRYVTQVLGIVYLVTQSQIFSWFRLWFGKRMLLGPGWALLGGLVYCPACFGFWVGAATFWRLPWAPTSAWQAVVESAFFSMVLGAIWSNVVHSPAAETELRSIFGEDDAE